MNTKNQASLDFLGTDAAALAAIVESSDDAIISQTFDGIIRTWNKGAQRIFGYSADEAVGKPFDMLIPPDRKDEDMRMAQRLRQGERVDHFETVRITKDSRNIDVSVTISPIEDSRGNITSASRIIRDMTQQRRRSELALNDSAARLHAVIDNAADGIITTDEDGTIESVNPAAMQIFGYTREELMGQNIKLLMPEPDHSQDDMYLANYHQTGLPKIIDMCHEVVGQRKDGCTFPVDLSVSEVRLGESRIFTGIVRDITQRKNAEAELLRAIAQAEEANKAKDHFLSILSHELRTPLTPVLAEMSFIEVQDNLPDSLRSRIGMIRRNIETEARLVDDLLDLTRISRGIVNLHFEVVDAQEALRGVVRMLQSQIEAKSLEVSIGFRAKQHHVWADPGRLQQIFLNLISNAVKFTPEDGSIGISTRNERETQLLRIEIIDTGIGIEPEKLSRLFKPFEQVADSRRYGGLGLGLSIAKSLTDMHKGTIRVHSEGCDRGTKFTLEFTTIPAVQPASPAARSVAQPQNFDRRVLLVEDHSDTRMVLERLLKSFGCKVVAADCVAAAIEAANEQAFDLLISDIGLPDGTGLQLIQKLRPGRTFRSIALSGFGQEEDIQRSREAGFEMHLTKPINFKTLQDAIYRVAVPA